MVLNLFACERISEKMDKNKSDSDLNADFISLYGNNRRLMPEGIKVYALYEKLTAKEQVIDNFVVASEDTNEVSVFFNAQSDRRVFTFDKIFNCDGSQNERFDFLSKNIIQDVNMGLNHVLFVCRLATPSVTHPFSNRTTIFNVDAIGNLTENILKELLLYSSKEENMDSSLLISYFEVHDDKIIDFLNCHKYIDIKVYENTDMNCLEVQGLVEKPLDSEKDISELLSKQQSHSFLCQASCCHSVLCVSLIKKNVNCYGFEFIKLGKLTVVGFTKCQNSFLVTACENSDDLVQKFAENQEFLTSSKYKIFDILRPAFGGNAKTSIIVTLSSTLFSLEKDINILQFITGAQKILNYPEINLKIIILNSLKEYSEEIQEFEKDFNGISNGTGLRLSSLAYRFYKNVISLEKEKVKSLNNYLLSLTDSVNVKKQSIINFHAISKATDCEVKDVEKIIENLKLDIDKIKSEKKIKQKVSMKADEILAMKQVKITNEFYIKKLKSELTKNYCCYEELKESLENLKGDVISLSCNMGAEQTSLRSTLQLLMVDMKNTLLVFQAVQEGLLMKLNKLNDIDVLLKIWRQNTESLLSKFSFFMEENLKNLRCITAKTNTSSLVPLFVSQSELLEKIKCNRNEKWKVLSYYFHKIQIFCDSSFKALAEVICQLDAIQNCYKTELKTTGAILCSFNKAFKKFVSDMSVSLKAYQQYYEEEEKKLSEMTDMICIHHKFKKNFDENIEDIKCSLSSLKQMCLDHNDATNFKWNEIQNDCHKTSENYMDLSEHLSMIHKETSKYLDNLLQQKLNTLECSPMKDKTINVENKMNQLLQTHKEMKPVIGEAFDVHKKGTNKELLEIRECRNVQKVEVEKYVDNLSLNLKNRSKSFCEELRSIQQTLASCKDELKRDIESLSSSIDELPAIHNKYKSVSNFILEKSERSFKIMPTVREDIVDNLPDISCLILDDWKITTSTPNIQEKKKILNLSYEKEKLLSRIRSVVEQQRVQKLNMCDLNSDAKEKKNHNISAMSLPNLTVHSKVSNGMGRNFTKIAKKPL